MPDRDTALARPGDIAEALALLTRLPVPVPAARRGAAAAWAYPLAGLGPGLLAVVAVWLGAALPPAVVAGLALAVTIAATGALHEDGLADTADGLWGGWTRAERLKIMRDSRIGTYGVLALILSLGLRWAALAAIAAGGGLAAALIAAAILSRAPMVALMHLLPNARGSGLSAATGRPGGGTTLLALGLALVLALPVLGLTVLPLALLLALATGAIAVIAKTRIGGQTGDILGAAQQIGEIAILIALAA